MNLDHAAGVGGYVTLGETTYHCTPLTLEDFGEAQAYLKARTPDPMEGIVDICNALPVEVAKVLAQDAYKARQSWGSLDSPEGLRWLASADGLAFFIFRQTRRHHPEVTMDEIKVKCVELEAHVISQVFGKLEELSGLVRNPPSRAKRKLPAKKGRR